MSQIYGKAFSKEVIDSQPTPNIGTHLVPWLKKELEDAKAALLRTRATKIPDEKKNDADYLNRQKQFNEGQREFYEGKIYLIGKILDSDKLRACSAGITSTQNVSHRFQS